METNRRSHPGDVVSVCGPVLRVFRQLTYILRRQKEIIPRIQVFLHSLIGHSRGQMERAQFFCMAAYYGENDVLQTTFLEAGSESFEEYLSKKDLNEIQKHWHQFAQNKLEGNLPRIHETKFTRSSEGHQYILPPYDENLSFKPYRKVFERFLELSWVLVWPASSEMPGIPYSQVLESPHKFFREKLLEDVRVKVDDVGQIDTSSLLRFPRPSLGFSSLIPKFLSLKTAMS
ncbi:hypothetical protein K435DRAFT_361948 [Dendrothele bispora CBS 962.96]|uniref:Uncharacterized protein n=1 Tax=Dendrothele bispora (strain CBS 962.96) TaxID=1314807 RepID=A0A4V4HHC8_DENBC|nr:hypothetical protein K435DRAFT_361948 [Dendrothele bispora CBS 962.96]